MIHAVSVNRGVACGDTSLLHYSLFTLHYFYPHIARTITHTITPSAVGNTAPRTVQPRLPVSFFMVKRVVEQGQCSREKSITHPAVTAVQPFWASNAPKAAVSPISARLPPAV